MLRRSSPFLWVAMAIGVATSAGAHETEPSFEPIRTRKIVGAASLVAPAPVSYGLEASVDERGRLVIRCKGADSPAWRRWQEALRARGHGSTNP